MHDDKTRFPVTATRSASSCCATEASSECFKVNKSVPPSFCCFLGSCCCVSFAVVSSIWCAQTVQCVTTRTVFLFSIRQNNLPITDRQSVVVVGRWPKMGHPTEAPIAASYHIVCASKKNAGTRELPVSAFSFPPKKNRCIVDLRFPLADSQTPIRRLVET